MKGGGVIAIKEHKPLTIKSQEAARGADPQITVGGLRERLHDLLGKTILHLPFAFAESR
jgi:hypothetical protein